MRRLRKKIPVNLVVMENDPEVDIEKLERQKVKLDIEILKSIKVRYSDLIGDKIEAIIKKLKDYGNHSNNRSSNSISNFRNSREKHYWKCTKNR